MKSPSCLVHRLASTLRLLSVRAGLVHAHAFSQQDKIKHTLVKHTGDPAAPWSTSCRGATRPFNPAAQQEKTPCPVCTPPCSHWLTLDTGLTLLEKTRHLSRTPALQISLKMVWSSWLPTDPGDQWLGCMLSQYGCELSSDIKAHFQHKCYVLLLQPELRVLLHTLARLRYKQR